MRELIYKDEVYKAIDNCIRDGWNRISPSEAKMNIHHLVSDANEADKPQGEWVYSHEGTIAAGLYCSNCGKHGYGEKYCPNCGVRMKGVNNE